MRFTVPLFLASLMLVAFACGDSQSRALATAEDAAPPVLVEEAGSELFDFSIEGKVFAPDGKLPLAGVLVYVTDQEPGPIADGPYCDKCVALPSGSFVVSAADGQVSLPLKSKPGEKFLVVQKGPFRRVTPISLSAGDPYPTPSKDALTLPGKTGPGAHAPKMLVLKGDTVAYDAIDVTLKNVGVEDVTVLTGRKTLLDLDQMNQYQVILLPCGEEDSPFAVNSKVQANLRDWVGRGGRLYTTDYSYEFVRKTFGGFIAWQGQTNALGSAAGFSGDGAAQVNDEGMHDWLDALGDKSFDLLGVYTQIKSVNAMPGKDESGKDVTITPKVWMSNEHEKPASPATVSFSHQCGRVLFSTYHSENEDGQSTTLSPQEKALLYVLFEVSTCLSAEGEIL